MDVFTFGKMEAQSKDLAGIILQLVQFLEKVEANTVSFMCQSVARISCLFSYLVSLQKQSGCFNHSMVTLVADKLKKHW